MGLELFQLTDRVAIVTGGGRGIGRSIALGLAEVGAHVVVADFNAPLGEETAADIRKLGRKSLAISTDVQYAEPVQNLVDKTMAEFGKIDILVNNAGGNFPRAFADMSEKAWDALIRENLKSVFLCTSAVGKVMLKQKRGSIINMASLAGILPYAQMTHYATAKAGIIHLTRSLAQEWGPLNIRVNAIAPGFIETPGIIEWMKSLKEKNPNVLEDHLKCIGMKRLGKPDDLKGLAIFLASDASSYITGTINDISGGLLMFPPPTV